MEASTTAGDTILGIDTATADAAVAAVRDAELLAELRVEPEPGGRPRHAAAVLDAVSQAVGAAGGWERIQRIALGLGPGTFTGLRVGIATGRALAQARGLAIAPVVSLAALAAGAAAGRTRLALIDARRGEVFAAAYGDALEPLLGPIVAPPAEVGTRALQLGRTVVGVGDGSVRFRAELEAAGIEVPPDSDPAHRMAARHICELGERTETVRTEQVTPIYLRRPDAEVWRER